MFIESLNKASRAQGSGNYGQNRAFTGSGNIGQNRAFNGSGNYGQNRSAQGSGFIDTIQGSGASFAPAVMPPDYQPESEQRAQPVAMTPKPAIDPKGTASACQHARDVAQRAAQAWQRLMPEAQRLANRSLAQDGEEAARHVADFETFTSYYQQAGQISAQALANVANVRAAVANANALADWAANIAAEAQAELARNNTARAAELADAAAQVNAMSQQLGAEAQAALDAYSEAASINAALAPLARAALERTRASVYKAGYQDTLESFERMSELAKRADEESRNGLSEFLRKAAPFAGGAMIVFAALAALFLFRR
jgi:hypothetical protein